MPVWWTAWLVAPKIAEWWRYLHFKDSILWLTSATTSKKKKRLQNLSGLTLCLGHALHWWLSVFGTCLVLKPSWVCVGAVTQQWLHPDHMMWQSSSKSPIFSCVLWGWFHENSRNSSWIKVLSCVVRYDTFVESFLVFTLKTAGHTGTVEKSVPKLHQIIIIIIII